MYIFTLCKLTVQKSKFTQQIGGVIGKQEEENQKGEWRENRVNETPLCKVPGIQHIQQIFLVQHFLYLSFPFYC